MKNGLVSNINWITFNEKDLQKANEILKDLGPDSTVDSIGLGIPFEEISNILFPATSTLHSRLRYQVFVPAIFYKMYLESAEKPLKNPGDYLYKCEVNLMRTLLENDPKGGVIGRIAQEGLKYWPSQTYWGAINAMKIFGSNSTNKKVFFDEVMHKGRNLIENDDGELEGEIKQSFVWDKEFHKIVNELFRDNQFKPSTNFDLTKNEALFLKKKLNDIDIGPHTLLNQWTNYKIEELESIKSFAEVPKTGNKQLDKLIEEAKNYSIIAMGITHAYRFVLCDFRANEVYKNFPEKKAEWDEYAKNNINNLKTWLKENKSLQSWNIGELDQVLRMYNSEGTIDSNLKKMVDTFQDIWKISSSAIDLAKRFSSDLKKFEEIRRRNRSHFIDWHMTIPENTQGLRGNSVMLFDYRFTQGRSNALDIVRGLRGRK